MCIVGFNGDGAEATTRAVSRREWYILTDTMHAAFPTAKADFQ